MRKLKHSAVVITGATSGVGRATALLLASKGAALMLAARREEELDEVVRMCQARGADAHSIAVDVSDEAAVADLAREAIRHFGRIDVWVNNASVNAYGRLEEMPSDWWRRVIETNLFGYFHGMKAALPWMREQGDGTIINVGSILDTTVVPYQSPYVAAKHGVRAISESVRQETKGLRHLNVCIVSPGPIDTPFFDAAANATGRFVEPPLRAIDPATVAHAIEKCARRPRPQLTVGLDTKIGRASDNLFPRLSRRLTGVMGEHDQFAGGSVRRHPGSLFEPLSDDTAMIVGGWRGEGSKDARRRRTAAAVAAGTIAMGAVAIAVGRKVRR